MQAKHYERQTIDITVKNQPFTPFKMTIGSDIVDASLYYSVQFKGTLEEEWHYYDPTYYVVQNDTGQSTTITFFVGANGPNGESTQYSKRIDEYLKKAAKLTFK